LAALERVDFSCFDYNPKTRSNPKTRTHSQILSLACKTTIVHSENQ
jgi:hypothetical protein